MKCRLSNSYLIMLGSFHMRLCGQLSTIPRQSKFSSSQDSPRTKSEKERETAAFLCGCLAAGLQIIVASIPIEVQARRRCTSSEGSQGIIHPLSMVAFV